MNTAATPADTAVSLDPGFRRDDEAWQKALAAWRRADSALSAATHSEDEDLYDRLGARHDTALVRLLRTPAPDLSALADKLDLLAQHQAWELTFADAALAAMRRDARRLASATRSS
jgi:hypothetical protein